MAFCPKSTTRGGRLAENGLEARHEDWEDLFMTVQEENDDDHEHDDDDDDGFDAHEFDEEYSDSFPISINLEQFRAICATRRLHHERSFGAQWRQNRRQLGSKIHITVIIEEISREERRWCGREY